MRDAAVGFQCPDCLKEGAKTTRQGRTAYGGKRSGDPRVTTYVLIGLNALVWIAIVATGWTKSTLVDRLALLPTGVCGSENDPGSFYPGHGVEQLCSRLPDGQWFPGVADGAYWQLVTSMFSHVEILHIGFNMVLLYVLGPQLEMALGRVRYLALYLVSGLAGSVSVYWLSSETSSTLGASGAIFGLIGGLAVVSFKVNGNIQNVAGLLLVNIAATIFVPGISWQGHLGGFVGGLIVTALLVYAPKDRRSQLQAAGIGLVTVALLVATIARTAALA
ncbi:rhomboid family intramembrane serine protease [Nocardioides humilatus]|uniref:Rhomboid family intramembrane serine protease n=2 Tax=Nocardioides humilatus TaxID=2607660 RepID=A0A5B1LI43_9ACTN|nr:rhomboid family intramembrane serine protease [Nocardioides humilatus]